MTRLTSTTDRLLKSLRLPNVWLVIFFFAGLGGVLSLFPKLIDDYWYMLPLREWFFSQDAFYPDDGANILKGEGLWNGLREVWLYHYLNDNIRLGNIINPLMLTLPKWVSGLVATVVACWTFFAVLRVTGVDWRRSPLVPVALLGFFYLIPWGEGLTTVTFQMNYVYSLALVLLLLNLLFDSPGARHEVLCALTAFLIGVWHEGIGVPVACGLLAASLFRGSGRRRFIVPCVMMFLGSGLLLISPGMRDRMIITGYWGQGVRLWLLICTLASAGVLPALYILVIRVAVREGWKKIARDKFLIFLLTGATVSALMMVILMQGLRIGLWSSVASLMILVYVLNRYYRAFWSAYSRRNICLLTPFMAFMYLQLGLAAHQAVLYKECMRHDIAAYLKNPDRTLFGKNFELKDIPPLLFYFPAYSFPNDNIMWMGEFYCVPNRGWKGFSVVVPEELRDVTADSGVPMPGGTSIRMKDGHLFAVADGTMDFETRLNLDMGRGLRSKVVRAREFVSEKDGNTYYYIYPFPNWLEAHFGHVERIEGPVEIVGQEGYFGGFKISDE